MADWLILGIDGDLIVICAEIGVAFGTIALAFVTYLSVKSSKESLDSLKSQVEIARMELENKQIELEKPQIIDQVKEVLNPLSIKIDQELNQINEKSLLWKSKAIGKKSPFFRFTSSGGGFYNEADVSSRQGNVIYMISTRFPIFKELCQKRYDIHYSIAGLFIKIYEEINTAKIDEKIGETAFKKHPSHQVYSNSGYADEMITLCDNDYDCPRSHEIPFDAFVNDIINIGIAKMLLQEVFPRDIYEEMEVSEFSHYEKGLKTFLKSESFSSYSKIFGSLIEELKNIDIQLKNEIVKIKVGYQERYHLTNEEFWLIPQKLS